MKTLDELNELTGQILDVCIIIHKEMGPTLNHDSRLSSSNNFVLETGEEKNWNTCEF